MFENVLIGVDGKPGGRDAIAFARRLTDDHGKLTLALVHDEGVVAAREDSDKLLEDERAAAGVEAELVSVAATSPGRGLHLQAERQGADLLVVGSCSRGALGRAMLGDDTRAALNGAPCAVAIASRGFAEQTRSIANVGVGYDASPESEAALATARGLAARTGAAVHALEVVSIPSVGYGGTMPAPMGSSIDAMLQDATSRMGRIAGVEGRAVFGLTGEELAALGDEVDVLVVGSRGYGPLRRLMLGSTSDYLERNARCPLVILPRVAIDDDDDAEPDAPDTSNGDVATAQ